MNAAFSFFLRPSALRQRVSAFHFWTMEVNMDAQKTSEHPLVQLARATIEAYIRDGKIIRPPAELSPDMKQKAGAFVSLHRRGELRGCIGTFAPMQDNVAEEVIHNAISSATQDPRFMPLKPRELADLDINVDVLSAPEPVTDVSKLDPRIYGIIVSAGRRRGLLLPDLEGVDTVADQIDICRRKGGISPDEPVQLQKFTVARYR
jgi:AmmeMemoRadiSam system protein A